MFDMYNLKTVLAEDWSADDNFKSVASSEVSCLAPNSSSSRLIKDSNIEKETWEQKHMMTERKNILRRKASYKSRGTSRSNTVISKSSFFLSELDADTSDSYTRQDSSYSSNMENVVNSILECELERDTVSLEILREGGKSMASIKLPTVIVSIKNLNLQHSMVYYVTLEAESEGFVGQIPSLMFSSQNYSGTTDMAELLPFRLTTCEWTEFLSLTPMLRGGCYKRIFRQGCNFKIIALSGIRAVDWSVECPWKLWDLNIKEMRKVVINIIYEDIRQIPKNILKALKPFKCD